MSTSTSQWFLPVVFSHSLLVYYFPSFFQGIVRQFERPSSGSSISSTNVRYIRNHSWQICAAHWVRYLGFTSYLLVCGIAWTHRFRKVNRVYMLDDRLVKGRGAPWKWGHHFNSRNSHHKWRKTSGVRVEVHLHSGVERQESWRKSVLSALHLLEHKYSAFSFFLPGHQRFNWFS